METVSRKLQRNYYLTFQNGEFYAWPEDRYGNSTRAGVEKWKKILFPSGRQATREKNFFTFLLPSEWNFHTYPPAMHRIPFYNVTKSCKKSMKKYEIDIPKKV